MDFIARKHGNWSLAELLKEFFINGDRDLTYRKVLGLPGRSYGRPGGLIWKSGISRPRGPRIDDQHEPWIPGHGQQMQAAPAGEEGWFFSPPMRAGI